MINATQRELPTLMCGVCVCVCVWQYVSMYVCMYDILRICCTWILDNKINVTSDQYMLTLWRYNRRC